MTWPRVPLDSVKSPVPYSFVGGPFGSELTSRDYVAEGVPVIRGNNLVGPGKFLDDDFVYVSDEKAASLRSNTAYPGDLIFTQRGTLGQVGLIPKDARFNRYVVSQSQMKLTVDEQKADPLYLYHFFRLPSTVQRILNRVSSSGVPHINLSVLKAFELPLPPRPTQETIVRMAQPYDDLIENSRHRIRLLEETAWLLYREWFVRFRFPGHEHVKIIDGVPEGWERKQLNEICSSVDYGYTASAEPEEVGPKFLRITDIVPDQIDWSTVPYCSIPEDKLDKFLLHEGEIVVARTGATVGFAKRLDKRIPDAVFASYLVRLRIKAEIDNLIVGTYVESEAYKDFVRSRVGGAAQPNANAKVLTAAQILIPPKPLQLAFRELVKPLSDQKGVLQLQNLKLRTTRDLFLPRLMSGEVEV